jgi:hypothetical protein
VEAVLDVGAPKQDNTTAAIVKPVGDWLLAPFGFAPPKATANGDDPGNTTQRIVPRALRGEPPAP